MTFAEKLNSSVIFCTVVVYPPKAIFAGCVPAPPKEALAVVKSASSDQAVPLYCSCKS